MDIARLVLDYLVVLLSWPVVTAIIALVFFHFFKAPISDFFRRIVRGEAYGVRLEATNPSEQVKGAEQSETLPPQAQIETWIAENPKQVLAVYQRAVNSYVFERAYNLIYGSQLALLEHLESKRDAGEKYANLLPFYNRFLQRSGLSTQFAEFIGFMRTFKFVDVVGEGSDLSLRITPYGVDFLSYLRTQYPGTYQIRAF